MSLILKNIIPTTTWNAIQSYITNLYVSTIDTTNTDSGGSSVTINAKGGVAVFSGVCSAGATLDLTITNSLFTMSTPILLSLGYDVADQGEPYILYHTKGNGNIVIRIKNSSGSDETTGNITIDFKIMN